MVRVTLGGAELAGMPRPEPAASVRLLLPTPGADVVVPAWNGNEFLLDDGTRPTIRTFTPRRLNLEALELDLDMVIHEGGIAAAWAEAAQPGKPAAISGPGRGYAIDAAASEFLLAGDQAAIPAIAQLLEHLPSAMPVRVHIELAHPDARMELPTHPRASTAWHELAPGEPPGRTLLAAVEAAQIGSDSMVWCAGEAAAMHRIRTHLFKERELPRSQATVRGYWKMIR